MRAYSATAAATSPPPAAPPLTPDAAAVLSRAAADASRRRHAHTTPLHAAAALLSGPSPLLRDACVAGLASPHPLRCRALDLCFAVALDRLPTSTEHQHHRDTAFQAVPAPPLSNALAAALKRAYAHHRRIGNGGVEADDHRVGVPHLVLAILDDPSVARVMREASFSSTAVKAAMLRSLSDPAAADSGTYVGPVVLHGRVCHREEEVRKVVEVLKRGKKRNPVLVGDTVDVEAVVQEVITMIQRQRLGDARVVAFPKELGDLVDLEREELVAKIRELGEMIKAELSAPASANASVVVSLGSLQWLVEGRCGVAREQDKYRDMVLDTARTAAAEMAAILKQSGDGKHRVWVIGTATCATYLKCQVYHPALESEWDLQAVPVAPRPSPPPQIGLSPSAGMNRGILSSSVEVLSSAMTRTMPRPPSLCNACIEGYERELAETTQDAALHPTEQPMSQWLQIGTPTSARPFDHPEEKARHADELRRRWRDRCAQLHSNARPTVVTCSEWNDTSILGNSQSMAIRLETAPSGTVDTDLALGPALTRPACDVDDKMLMKTLSDAVTWQAEAASAVVSTVMTVKSGEGKRRSVGTKADTWVLFAGPDTVGKRNMAETLSGVVFGTGAVTVRLSCPTTDEDGEESDMSCRGRTALDRVAEAIRANPFRVIVLDDLDQTDSGVHGSIIRAIESGRLIDSHGRDVSLGSAIFVVTTHWSPDHLTSSQKAPASNERKIVELSADATWSLELRVRHKTAKRRAEQPLDGDRRAKASKGSTPELPLIDLNLSMFGADHVSDDDDGSGNSSSDLTVEHEQEYCHLGTATCPVSSTIAELAKAVDGTVVFRPVGFEPLKQRVSDLISAKFGDVMGGAWPVDVDDGVLDRLVGAAWTTGASAGSFEVWADKVLCPVIRQLSSRLTADGDDRATICLSAVTGHGRRKGGDPFPTSVTVSIDGN